MYIQSAELEYKVILASVITAGSTTEGRKVKSMSYSYRQKPDTQRKIIGETEEFESEWKEICTFFLQ